MDRAENGDETEGESMGSILICGGGNEIITFTLMFTRCGLRCAEADDSSQTSTFCPRHEVPEVDGGDATRES